MFATMNTGNCLGPTLPLLEQGQDLGEFQKFPSIILVRVQWHRYEGEAKRTLRGPYFRRVIAPFPAPGRWMGGRIARAPPRLGHTNRAAGEDRGTPNLPRARGVDEGAKPPLLECERSYESLGVVGKILQNSPLCEDEWDAGHQQVKQYEDRQTGIVNERGQTES